MEPITDTLKHDALTALQARWDERRKKGVAHGERPQDWSDEAQTVGWCRDLLLRWPKDVLREKMVGLLAGFGYVEA